MSNLYTYLLPRHSEFSEKKVASNFSTQKHRAALVIKNALWFCKLRWIIVSILAGIGMISLFLRTRALNQIGINLSPDWPLILAAILSLFNGFYVIRLRHFIFRGHTERALRILWAQIIVDLLFLTAVVHYIGSIETPAPFMFLLHIVLSCIFLTRRDGLTVTLLAFTFYSACLFLEFTGVISNFNSLFINNPYRSSMQLSHVISNILLQLGIWLTIWHLSSELSSNIQKRDEELAITNQKLIETQGERTKHMLRTTHELKAPFAAIHANTQLLLNGYCGEIPETATPIIQRIAERSKKLSNDIQMMLQLANLNNVNKEALRWISIDLCDVLKKCIEQHRPLAQARKISIETFFQTAVTAAVEDHLVMLFSNLITNAINYSHPGSSISVRCEATSQALATIIVEDHGIGIAPEKLPRIFDEYYRTEEAAAFNKESSGLGLAIVKSVAQGHNIQIQVASELGKGTKFISQVPLVRLNKMKQVFGFLRGV